MLPASLLLQALEGGTAESSGMAAQQFDAATGHLGKDDLAYLSHMTALLNLEEVSCYLQ